MSKLGLKDYGHEVRRKNKMYSEFIEYRAYGYHQIVDIVLSTRYGWLPSG